jgi:hypothetical protein
MKKNLPIALSFLLSQLSYNAIAQITNTAVITGPSTTSTPYVIPAASNVTVTSLLTIPNAVGGYSMCGLPDGAGAYDNNDGTFTFLLNHEINNASGGVRAHGSIGAFVSKWVINKTTKAVISGSDLIQNVYLWTGATYTMFNATNPSTLAAFGRFCSGDLPEVNAFYNSATGNGTTARIFMNGEETGAEGRMFGHIATGSAAGNSYQLPRLGRFSCENYNARPFSSNKTVVVGMDDSSPGQVYVYIGSKTNTGTDVEKAGLTNGNLYGVAVQSLIAETNTLFPATSTTFSLINLGDVSAITGASLNTMSNSMGVTNFLRPEDGAWDPRNPNDFYFCTTNSFSSPSRLYRLRFTDVNNPENGGTILAVLDGTEGQKMIDNMGFDNYGNLLLQEDVGNNAHLGKQWNYNVDNDVLSLLTTHDANRFVSGGPGFLTEDEEASGAIDMQGILGAGWWMIVTQSHYSIPSPIVEGGQMLLVYNPMTVSSNPEINVSGASNNIPNNTAVTSATNNTNFGNVQVSNNTSRTFVINNAGPGALVVNSFTMTGTNASEFTLISPPSTPLTLAASANLSITVQFAPSAAGTRSATVNINNNDFDEAAYNFKVEGNATLSTVGIKGNTANEDLTSVFPNPAKDKITITIDAANEKTCQISIVDLAGKLVYEKNNQALIKGNNTIDVNTQNFADGTYFVKINMGSNSKTIKLIVSH